MFLSQFGVFLIWLWVNLVFRLVLNVSQPSSIFQISKLLWFNFCIVGFERRRDRSYSDSQYLSFLLFIKERNYIFLVWMKEKRVYSDSQYLSFLLFINEKNYNFWFKWSKEGFLFVYLCKEERWSWMKLMELHIEGDALSCSFRNIPLFFFFLLMFYPPKCHVYAK